MKTALIAGGTGLIGSELLKLLVESERYDIVKALTRSNLPITHPKLIQVKTNYDNLDEKKDHLKADDIFCCLGTTIAKAKSRENFTTVDFTYPVDLAKKTFQLGAKQFLIVSALGANPKSSIFYNRVKGEMEEAITRSKFQTVHIFRPSLLLGKRAEARPGEDAAKLFYKAFSFLIPEKYKGIEAVQLARAMFHFAKQEEKGIFIHESNDLRRI